jgi:hypothetical protein
VRGRSCSLCAERAASKGGTATHPDFAPVRKPSLLTEYMVPAESLRVPMAPIRAARAPPVGARAIDTGGSDRAVVAIRMKECSNRRRIATRRVSWSGNQPTGAARVCHGAPEAAGIERELKTLPLRVCPYLGSFRDSDSHKPYGTRGLRLQVAVLGFLLRPLRGPARGSAGVLSAAGSNPERTRKHLV